MGKESTLRHAYGQVCELTDSVSVVGPKQLRNAQFRAEFLAKMQGRSCEADDSTRIEMLLDSLKEVLQEVLGVTIGSDGKICPSRDVQARIKRQGCASAFLKNWNVQANEDERPQDVFPNAYSEHTATVVKMRERYGTATVGVFNGVSAIALEDQERSQIRKSLEWLHLMQIMKEEKELFDLYFQEIRERDQSMMYLNIIHSQ